MRWLSQRGLTLADATSADLLGWLSSLPATAQSREAGRKALRAWYRWAKIVPDPSDEIPSVPQPQGLPRPLSERDHLAWVAACRDLGGFHEAAGLLMATTGARISEVRLAEWEHFDLEAASPTWRVRGKGSGRKGARWRLQLVHAAVPPVLTAWRATATGRWVFPGRCGPVDDVTMRTKLVEIGEHAGLGRITPHRIRHSCATFALAHTRDIRAVGELLGHASLASTMIYTQVLPERLREVVDVLPS